LSEVRFVVENGYVVESDNESEALSTVNTEVESLVRRGFSPTLSRYCTVVV